MKIETQASEVCRLLSARLRKKRSSPAGEIRLRCLFVMAAIFAGILPAGNPALAADKIWNGTATETLWSSAANWLPVGAPGASDNVTFTNLGFADVQLSLGGLFDNVVDPAFTSPINSLGYRNITTFHNTSIEKPLLVQSTSTTDVAYIGDDDQRAIFFVGSGQADGKDDVVYTSIAGEALTVSNPNAVISVMQGSGTSGAHRATLDMSALKSFTATVSNILVGHDFGPVNVMRPTGTLILGTSNNITAELISVADAYQNAGSPCFVYLGEDNKLNVDRIRIALHKCPATMGITPGLPNISSVTFRNMAGTGRQKSWEVGDEYEPRDIGYFTSGAATGVLDLSGANVDAMVETITLGRGQTNAPIRNGDGVGTLTFGGGTINVNNLQIGIQLTGSGTTGRGTLNVNNDDGVGPATMRVNNNILMAAGLPQSTVTGATTLDIATATINVNGGILEVVGDIIDGGGNSTISINAGGMVDMMPGADTTPGNVTVDTLNINDGTITHYGTLAVSTIAFPGIITQFTVAAGETLAPVAVGTIGTLNVAGDLNLRGAVDIDVKKLGAVLSADKIIATGAIDLGGTLRVRSSGEPLALGDKFTIISGGTVANSFTTLTLPPAGAGLTWTNKTAIDGTIEIIASGEPTTAPTLAISKSGENISLSWPTAYTTFSLRGQTNAVTSGIGGSWGVVPGVANNQVTIPINTANGVVLFELFQQ